MVDFEKFKEALVKGGITGLPDRDIYKLRERQHKLAAIIFARWLKSIQEPKDIGSMV